MLQLEFLRLHDLAFLPHKIHVDIVHYSNDVELLLVLFQVV